MLETKIVGAKIASLRKKNGLSQEKLANMLIISPQAISKWENGHTLPETSLLPVLSQIFNCTIDEIIMPAYRFDIGIEQERPSVLEQQAQYIAKYLVQEIGGKSMPEKVIGLDDNAIINAVLKSNPNLSGNVVTRGKTEKKPRYTSLQITVTSPQKTIKLIEKIYSGEDKEFFGYNLFNQHTLSIPQIYSIDISQRTILMEDLNDTYIQGLHFDENTDNGLFIRDNYKFLISAAAKFHSTFWENGDAFGQTSLDWRHESKENLIAHIDGMEKDFHKYRKKEETGKIPKTWEIFENTIVLEKLEYFQMAIKLLKQGYGEFLDSRFHMGKNITIIHGDMHPGNTFMSKADDRQVKFIDMEAIRVGLCTEDLAMLIALHIEPDKEKSRSLLDYYYECLCKVIKDYSFETFMNDYKISIMENMFFPIRLINRGIYDFSMRDKAIKAFENFVLCDA